MKISNLTTTSAIYTSCAYLLRGTFNAIKDINTLIDVGRDPMIIDQINNAPTGVGKKRVEKVVLTHSHYDHAAMLPTIKDVFNPTTYAFLKTSSVDHLLTDGQMLHLADRTFEVIHIGCHSHDSIWLYCEEEGVLFSGDTPVLFHPQCGAYSEDFITRFAKMAKRKVTTIYPGHGPPLDNTDGRLLKDSLRFLRQNSK